MRALAPSYDMGLLWLGQTKYARDMHERFGMAECKAVSTPTKDVLWLWKLLGAMRGQVQRL